jgi:hypothetical protein
MNRAEFEILKHFKDRLTGEKAAQGSLGFDLEEFVLYRCIIGSRAYGLETDGSDTDVRGIYIAPAEMQWSLFGAPEQFEELLLGAAKIHHDGAQGQPERTGMLLFTPCREGNDSWRGTPRHARAVSF